MRSHSALYVDAGYLVAAAATRATGSSLRAGVDIEYGKLVSQLVELLEEQTALPILRVYWYDAARDGKASPSQEQIAILPKVKLRLGRIGVDGEQKGVDLRIGLDMVGHARNGAVDTMYLISGDDDLTEAVEEAQAQGVQVVILAVPTASGTPQGVSRHLRLAADDIEVLTWRILDGTVTAARKIDGSTTGKAEVVPQPVLDVAPTTGGVPTPANWHTESVVGAGLSPSAHRHSTRSRCASPSARRHGGRTTPGPRRPATTRKRNSTRDARRFRVISTVHCSSMFLKR
ncbi:NYN domain-containing protein [Curtobacterium sp. VKM Ac-1376]|nr:NYN domain-containing protein [Curtobacterium sp. VKM Ac-1376]